MRSLQSEPVKVQMHALLSTIVRIPFAITPRSQLTQSSCSVLCSKQHQASHSADEPPNILPTPPPPVPKVKPATLPRPGTVAAAGVRSSFAVLDDSEQLRTLFRTYPGLASQLKRIHDATLRPCEDTELNAAGHKRHSKSGGRDWDFKTRKQPWTPDRGLENGVRALNRARQDCGDSGEAVREFSDLILQLMRREEGGIDVAEIIQRELTEKSTKLIEQLLQEEMAKLRPTW